MTGLKRVLCASLSSSLWALVLGCSAAMPPGLGAGLSGELAPCPSSPNCVTSQEADAGHRIEPLEVAGDPAAAWAALEALIEDTPDAEIVSADGRYLHAAFTTRWMRYVDDVEFRMRDDGVAIDVRSASRIGYGDMGANRARVEWIRDVLAQRGHVRARTDP